MSLIMARERERETTGVDTRFLARAEKKVRVQWITWPRLPSLPALLGQENVQAACHDCPSSFPHRGARHNETDKWKMRFELPRCLTN